MNKEQIKPERAIEILTEDSLHPTAKFMPELVEAVLLGIEALKCLSLLHSEEYEPPLLNDKEITQVYYTRSKPSLIDASGVLRPDYERAYRPEGSPGHLRSIASWKVCGFGP